MEFVLASTWIKDGVDPFCDEVDAPPNHGVHRGSEPPENAMPKSGTCAFIELQFVQTI
jgi:hypothetical protein